MRRQGEEAVPAQRNAAPGPRAARTKDTAAPGARPARPAPSAEARLRYWFDTTLARGIPVLCGWLALGCLALVVPVSALLVWTDQHTPTSLGAKIAAVWRSTGQTMRLGGEVGPPLRVVLSVLLALIALLYVSTLVSLITTGLTDRLIALDRGRATILEHGHTVVLGWSEQIPTVVSELVAAHTDRRRRVIAVLADRDKGAMEEELHVTARTTGRVRVLCRTGRPTDPVALARVSPATADCVLVLPRDDPRDDAETVKTLLSLTAATGDDPRVRVVAAVRDGRHLTAARLAGGPRATVLDTDDISARLLVDCARQPGLSLVHQELLDFAGHEFHTLCDPALTGRAFGEAAGACPESIAVGIAHDDGTVTLNPPPATPFRTGDGLLVIAEDEHSARLSDHPVPYDPKALAPAPDPAPAPAERVLVLGWNRRAPRIADQLSRRIPPGSTLDVVAEPRTATTAAVRAVAAALAPRTQVRYHPGDPTLGPAADAPEPGGHDVVIVLAPDPRPGRVAPDDRVLVTLLHLRAREEAGGRHVPVVAELGDDRDRLIAPRAPGADFVVSGRLVGLLMTQISRDPRLAAVFEELLSPAGNTLHLRPAAHYVTTGRTASFAAVAASAAHRGECAVGYRSATAPGHGMRINPPKTRVRYWHGRDQVVVIAPGDRGANRDSTAYAPAVPRPGTPMV